MKYFAFNTYPLVVPLLSHYPEVKLITVYDLTTYGKLRNRFTRYHWIKQLDALIFAIYCLYKSFSLSFTPSTTLIFYTHPPFLASIVIPIVKRSFNFVILHTMDVYPEMLWKASSRDSSWAYRVLVRYSKWSFKFCDRVVLIGEDQRALPSLRAVDSEKIFVHHNPSSIEIRRQKSDKKQITIGYFGSYGYPHEIENFLSQIVSYEQIEFVLVSRTNKAKKLFSKFRRHDNFKFYSDLCDSDFKRLLETIDLYLVALDPELNGVSIPSKIYTALNNKIPILFIGDYNSKLAHFIAENGGLVYDEDMEQLDKVELFEKILNMNDYNFINTYKHIFNPELYKICE